MTISALLTSRSHPINGQNRRNVPPENPAQSLDMCAASKACSMCGRSSTQRVEGTTKIECSHAVALDADTVRVLKAHRARQDADKLKLSENWKGKDTYVFTTGWGEPVFPDTLSSRTRR
ncbi:hypothetical protein [Nonomuraea dietziae]|uniref:hypothetical protein n=1 Tax=Nonomuraea dietziae TaxID=65515 RepID=UPI00344A14D8